ncbi:MOSC domain-containing protein [Phycicoccus sonneratiae]|uniref:MOSC domain-containing protein n=1 Tax=Phycicoccus sonneratiae TaxID=2807628 RepID=A0ABS2CQ34_9MICO|nr:MOSC domain-containing protein [Phycicoccus sonneraticus]MBM6401991.1 MOSC domain-containing protein [Phycicoccus sonneraticus]
MPEPADDLPVVTAIHLAPGRRLPVRAVEHAVAEAGAGLVGDRYHGSRHRHVTVQSAEQLAEAAERLGAEVPASGTRRNLTVSRDSIVRTPGARARVGEVLLEVVRVAAPCRILDDEIGPGAAAALHDRAGTVFRVLEGGRVAVGDRYEELPFEASEAAQRAAASRAAASAASAASGHRPLP